MSIICLYKDIVVVVIIIIIIIIIINCQKYNIGKEVINIYKLLNNM